MVRASKEKTTKTGGDMKWEERHTHALARGIIQHLLTNRPSFLHLPGLNGEVDGHGGSRVSTKIIDMCKKMAVEAGMGAGVVQEIISLNKGVKRGREGSTSPVKAGAGKGKGKRVKKEVEAEVEDVKAEAERDEEDQ